MSRIDTIERVCAVNAEHVSIEKSITTWPFSIVHGAWYLHKCFPKELLNTIRKLKSRGLSSEGISQLFKNPTRISSYLHFIKGPPDNLSSEERLELIRDLVEYLVCYRKEDPLCETGKNILLTENQVSEVERDLFQPDFGIEQLLGGVVGTYFAYTEMLWGANHGLGHEFHGPYPSADGEKLFVFNYYDLRPMELFPATSRLPFTEIEVGRVYTDASSMFNDTWFDMFGHIFFSPGSLGRFYVKIDRKLIESKAEIEMALESAFDVLRDEQRLTEAFTERDLIRRWIELYYYSLKPHKEVLGEDWKPSEEVYSHLSREIDMEEIEAFGKMWMGVWSHTEQQERYQMFKEIFLQNVYRKD